MIRSFCEAKERNVDDKELHQLMRVSKMGPEISVILGYFVSKAVVK